MDNIMEPVNDHSLPKRSQVYRYPRDSHLLADMFGHLMCGTVEKLSKRLLDQYRHSGGESLNALHMALFDAIGYVCRHPDCGSDDQDVKMAALEAGIRYLTDTESKLGSKRSCAWCGCGSRGLCDNYGDVRLCSSSARRSSKSRRVRRSKKP